MVIFRTDASVRIGSGHVMRCLTLAEQFRQTGADVRFVTHKYEGNLNELIRGEGFKFYELSSNDNHQSNQSCGGSRAEHASWLGTSQKQDALETIDVLKDIKPDWLIVDHYALDETWEQMLRPYVRNIMVIDDLADRKHDCDILLDQNYVSDQHNRYADLVLPSCTMLLGPEYALLRKEFSEARKKLKKRDGSVRHVFVFFGGVDPDNITGKSLEALSDSELSHLEVDVVVGAANQHQKIISRLVNDRSNTSLHVQVKNIAALMARADLALCAGGTTTWERLCLGLSSIVVTVADNQVRFTRDLHNDGLLWWLGSSKDVGVAEISEALKYAVQDTQINRQKSNKGMNVVDGKGVERVIQMLMQGPDPNKLQVRRTVDADCELFWHWANDPEVRKNAFTSDSIPWETHKAWFSAVLQDHDTTAYVIECDKSPIGQVRFERKRGHYLISYSLARQYRGMGLGEELLKVAIETFKNCQCFTLKAEVKADNVASNKIFEKLGFSEEHPIQEGRRLFQLQFFQTEMPG